MKKRMIFPIRLKILVALLSLVTVVVSLITFTMANLFLHEDKKTYINDLASMVALSTAEECSSLLDGYGERLRVYGRIMGGSDLSPEGKADLLRDFFHEFDDLIWIALYRGDEEIASVHDAAILEAAGLTKEDVREYRKNNPIPDDILASGKLFVENSTIHRDLPTVTVALQIPGEKDEQAATVMTIVRLDKLQRLSARSDVFEVFVTDVNGRLLAHPDPDMVAAGMQFMLPEEIERVSEERSASLTIEHERAGEAMIGGFAGVDVGEAMAGALVPKTTAYIASKQLLNRLLLIALGLLILSALASVVGSRRLTSPIERLSRATRDIARGDFGTRVKLKSRDEMGTLADSFNQMATGLKDRDDALEESQKQLIQSEKMAAFGQLGAGIAHEIKNPLAGILGMAQISQMDAEPGSQLHENLAVIEKETKRCNMIIMNLLKFGRQEKAMLEPTEVLPVVQDAIAIVRHQLEINKAHLNTELPAELPKTYGNANQLQQVLINLLINAQQAMDGEPGTVTLVAREAGSSSIEIRVEDTGPGIPEEVRARVFEPFFTTKPTGKGTGLGLSVSYGIIKDHGGEIVVESAPGEGTTFIITLPVMGERSKAVQQEMEAPTVTSGAEAD